MRITFCLPVVGMNGGIRVVAIYAQALARMGHQVTLVSPPPQKPTWKQSVKSLLKRGQWPSSGRSWPSHLDGLGLDHRILDRWRAPRNEDVPDGDAVIATWWETAEWVQALDPGKGAKVYFIQGHEVFPHLPVERCRATYLLPLHKIVIARWLKDLMKSHYGDESVDLVPNSVDRTQFFAPPREKQPVPTVGFLYSTSVLKGLDVALDVIRSVRARIPNLRLVSFSADPPTAEFPLPSGTEFAHSPPQAGIRDLYSRCDVWLAASRSEGFNLTALEAMACRTPVVSTRTGWPAEALEPGKNGYLVDIDDREGLAAGLLAVLSKSPEEWKAISDRAYETAARGSWEQSARLFEGALRRACERAKKGEIAGTVQA